MTASSRHRGCLALVRHAQSTWVAEGRFQGRGDPPLSELGRRQATLLAGRLRDTRAPPALPFPDTLPVAIHHSPLRRASDTAVAIAEALGAKVPLISDEALTEVGQGEWEGLGHAEVESRWPHELEAWRRSPWSANAPGGETLPEASRRVARALAAVTLRLGGAPSPLPWLIVVTHDGVLRLALMQLLGISLEHFWSFPFPLCGVTVVEVEEGYGRLHAHGLVEHLASLEQGTLAASRSGTDRQGAL